MAPSMFDVRRFIRLPRVQAVAPSPGGGWLAVQVERLDAEGARFISDLWRVDRSGHIPPHALTQGEASDRAPAFRADGTLLFLSDRPRPGTSEPRTQVWSLSPLGGDAVPITDEPLGVEAFQVAGDALVVQTSVWPGVPHDQQRAHDEDRRKKGPSVLRYDRMPVRHWDHWRPTPGPHLVLLSGGRRRDLTPTADHEHRLAQWHLAADGRSLVTTCRRVGEQGAEEVDLLVITLESGASTRFTGGPRCDLESPRLSPDGTRVACVRSTRTHPPTHRPRLCLIDVASGAMAPLADAWEAFPQPVAFTPDGAALIVSAELEGRLPAFQIGLDGTVTRLIDPAAGGTHTSLALLGSDHLVGIRSTLTQPPEPFITPLQAGATPTVLACFSGFDPGEVPVHIDEFSVASPDGTPVQSFLLRPTEGGPHPLLLWIHGGPMSAHADVWHWRWNPLVAAAAGYAVALPNPRGSTGFGQAFVDGVWDNRMGAECYQDVLAITDALAARKDLDSKRFVAMGGSFGGYMANLLGTRSDRFQALVSHAGIYSYPQFRSTTDEPTWFAYGFGFEPDTDREAFTRHCPQHAVKGWRTPTLVMHGDKDYRVPVTEALALFEALQRHQVPSELVIFPDENHWIQKPRNIVAWYEAWLGFVGRYAPVG